MIQEILNIHALLFCNELSIKSLTIHNTVKAATKKLSLTIAFGFISFLSFAQPNFSASFSPTTIGPGSVSKLVFTIDNSGGSLVSDLSFTNTLPAGLTIATPSFGVISSGSGTLTAPEEGTNLTYSDGTVGAGKVITIGIYVTSTTPGTHINTSGDLTSSGGNSGTASAELTIATDRPGFSKSFSPATVNLGERSTLTFTIDNSVNLNAFGNLAFTDNLPQGMLIASPANATSTCSNSTITAVSGSSVISFTTDFFPLLLEPESTCFVSVDVFGQSNGQLNNITSDLTGTNSSFQSVNSGKASARLDVRVPTTIHLQKKFVTNPASPGGTTDIEYTISNFDRNNAATAVTFIDDLGAILSGLAATGTPLNDICGAGSQLSGTGVLSFMGGNIPAGGSCTFRVPIQVPAGVPSGTYTSTSSTISANFGGTPIVGNTATEKLFVANVPTFTKTFLTNPIAAGGTTTVEFTITNTSGSSALTDVTFSNIIDDFITGATFSSLPTNGSCGSGSVFNVSTVVGSPQFQMTGGEIPTSSSCTFTVDVTVPTNQAPGTYTYSTNNLSGTVDGVSVVSPPASAQLTVLALPKIRKAFINGPVNAGAIVNLEYTITYDEFATGDATSISFTDDLNAVIPGLSAVGLPSNDVCGTGATITGTNLITLTGGTLSPDGSCTFIIPVQVPAGALPGTYSSTSSNLTAAVGGLTGTGNKAVATLTLGGLNFTKEFVNDPAIPGGLVTLRYTIENTTTFDATNLVFTDNLNGALSGMAAEAPLPSGAAACNGTLSGTQFLIYTGGAVPAGTNCTFDVLVRVPSAAVSGNYASNTSNLTATLNGNSVSIPPARDRLIVNNNLISLSKTFTDDPVIPGGTVTVSYTLQNLDLVNAVDNIAFTDNFGAALTGLAATGLPVNNTCGAGSALSGTSTLSFTGGSLAPGGSCSFSVTLQTPASTPYGTIVTSTTSVVTGNVGSLAVIGNPVSDNLSFQSLRFSKAFAGPVEAGGTAALTYTITNIDPTNRVTDISFSDNLDAFISGAIATNLPLNNTCGESSAVTGTSIVNFSRGELAPGLTCSFTVQVKIPANTTPATYTSTTGLLSSLNFPNLGNTSATLVVNPSSNANLSALTTTAGAISPAFASATTAYTASIDNLTTSITVTPTVSEPNATVTVNGTAVNSGSASGAINLTVGANTVTVVVTAQDGTTTKSYTVEVTRSTTCLTVATATELLTWTGAKNTNWNDACNWSPIGIPTATNDVTIPSAPTNQPTLSVATALAKSVEVYSGATLTIANTGTLTINNSKSFTVGSATQTAALLNRGTLGNNGTIVLGNTGSIGECGLWNTGTFSNNSASEISINNSSYVGLFNGLGTFTNAAKIIIGANTSIGVYGLYNTSIFINNSGGEIRIDRSTYTGLYNFEGIFTNAAKITIGENAGVGFFGIANRVAFNNNNGGEISIDRSTILGIINESGTFTNAAKITIGGNAGVGIDGIRNQATFDNSVCGEVVVKSGIINITSGSTNTNAGYTFVATELKNDGTFTNNGILKYATTTGNAVVNTSNPSVIVKDSPIPIFEYGGSYDGNVNGIFTNEAATLSAGTFTPPNAFVPSGLPAGLQTLYAKITQNGCSSAAIVPFKYCNTTLIAGLANNPTTCNGTNGSIAFTTNLSNGNYTLNYTKGGTVTTASITVASGTFSLSGLTAGSYSAFSITNEGCIGNDVSTKTLTDPIAPTASISGTDNLGCLMSTVTRTASGGETYFWSNGLGTNAQININTAGTYTVTVTAANSCTATATTEVTTGPIFSGIITSHPVSSIICQGNHTTFSTSATGVGITYQWQINRGSGFENIVEDANFGNVTSYILQVSFPPVSMNGYQFRCEISQNTCTRLTDVANITVQIAAEAITIVNISPVNSDMVQQAVSFIVALNKINSPAKVQYLAGNAIELRPGFEAKSGTVFTAKIQNACSSSGITSSPNSDEIPKEIIK